MEDSSYIVIRQTNPGFPVPMFGVFVCYRDGSPDVHFFTGTFMDCDCYVREHLTPAIC